jgi:hypothetical protein
LISIPVPQVRGFIRPKYTVRAGSGAALHACEQSGVAAAAAAAAKKEAGAGVRYESGPENSSALASAAGRGVEAATVDEAKKEAAVGMQGGPGRTTNTKSGP